MITAEQMKDIAAIMDKMTDAESESAFFVFGDGAITVNQGSDPVGEIMKSEDGLAFQTS